MDTNIENAKPAGHAHDIAPTAVLATHGSCTKLIYDHETRDHTNSEHVAGGKLDMLLGVDGDEVTITINVGGFGFADNHASTTGKMDIERTEHIIRSLIAVVKEAKKNAIDKPTLFGGEYS